MLLILAGVSIATLTGENGILTRAQDAAIETRASQVEEIVELWKESDDWELWDKHLDSLMKLLEEE